MSLRTALNTFARTGPLTVGLPRIPATVEANARLAKLFGDGGTPWTPAEDLDDFSFRLADLLMYGDPLSGRDLLRSPWCIWSSAYPLSRNPDLVERLMARVQGAGRRNVYRGLAAAWLHSFRHDGLCVPLVGEFLQERLDDLGAPWKEAHAALRIFDPSAGPECIVDAALQGDAAPDDILSRIGFRDRLASGYREQIYRSGFERHERETNANPLQRLRIVRHWTYAPNGQVRHEALKTAAVRAALDPFADETPDQTVRDAFLEFALCLLRDPRLHPEGWTDCPKSERIARRWLVEQSLRQFFAVLDEFDHKDKWAYRRAFWNALYEKQYIDDAWVVLESAGAGKARNVFGQNIGFGRFEGFQPGHAVLLLSVRGLTVAEWSHNNPCSIWDKTDGAIGPSLHKHWYSASELKKQHRGEDTPANMASQGIFPHHGAGRYRWQSRIAEYLKQRRGLTLDPGDYRVDH
jgi:hypothetical protein